MKAEPVNQERQDGLSHAQSSDAEKVAGAWSWHSVSHVDWESAFTSALAYQIKFQKETFESELGKGND